MTNEIKKNMMMDEELDQVTGGSLFLATDTKATSWIKSTASATTTASASTGLIDSIAELPF